MKPIFLLVLLLFVGLAQAAEERAIFAGGCFWCMQPPFDKEPGVLKTVVGYTGGTEENPTYKEVSSHQTGHREAIEVTFDSDRTSYTKMLDVFWRQINPTQPDGQFHDIGHQYMSAIYYSSEEQRRLAEESKVALGKSGRFDGPIVTTIEAAGKFWPAEAEHQKYYLKNPAHYKAYSVGSGRAGYLKRIWGE